ncbi:troponin C (macronuclear) [Tetrahymena thermophila SB210]|uniref:Troponin C n=1 Tax=Tetrahymena thermophila (strain SB210) TaxID=312017 RepID=Q22GU4_TETTS|nr:troponin C [Tetrahymena thermophila SB210]EAR84580.2 troponin C [Tetrahymena thermophila SB210]|eukprot:XP_001032243.2 troponin C [Tetrahymena thermophila SB210]
MSFNQNNISITTPSSGPKASILKQQNVAQKKRGALQNTDDYSLIIGTTGLERFEIEKLKAVFSKFDLQDKGFIMKYELDDVFKFMEFMPANDIKKYVNDELQERDRQQQTIEFIACCEIYSKIKKRLAAEEEEAQNIEYIDAFVALGGNFDRTGVISKEVIINTIKNEFGLLFDIEKLFDSAHITSENLTFQDFCMMFESSEDSKSLISAISNQQQFRQTQLTSGFDVKYKDFETWNAQF